MLVIIGENDNDDEELDDIAEENESLDPESEDESEEEEGDFTSFFQIFIYINILISRVVFLKILRMKWRRTKP